MIKPIKYITCLLFLIALGGCEKITDVGGPLNGVTDENVFQNDATTTSAVIGLYSKAMLVTTSFLNGGISIFSALSADELVYNFTDNPVLEFSTNSLQPSNQTVRTTFWTPAYNLLYQVNACIEGITRSNALSSSVKEQLLGECYFIRAFIYFNLINLFGDVPLVLTTNYESNAVLPRGSKTLIKSQIKQDLTLAIGLLHPDYPTAYRARANKWAALGLMARMSLYDESWSEAESEATQIINSGVYSLEPDLNNVFLYTSKESMLQLMPVSPGYNTTEGNQLVPLPIPSAIPQFSLSSYLINAFEPGDKRSKAWIADKQVGATNYTYPYKYKLKSKFGAGFVLEEYYVVFRLAEQYLLRAEARAHQHYLSGAIADLDSIRSRAGIPLLSATNPNISEEDLLIVIQKERQTELFVEWGHRWFDLKRTKQADAVLKSRKSGWNATDTLYPIPGIERTLNPNLSQNDGYN